MSSLTKFLIGFPVVFVLAVGFYIYAYTASTEFKRSFIGREIRRANGEPGAVQRTDDLAEDIQRKRHLAPLQSWAVETMERFRDGRMRTAGSCVYYPFSRSKLATNEVPQFIRDEWWQEPEVSVVTTTNGQPQCVAISWYLHGVLVGPTNYVKTIPKQFDPLQGIWYLKQVRPGIYVYHLYK
jgi:hypothetical protein